MLTRKAFFGAVFFFTSITENMMVTDGKFSDQHISWAKNCPKFFILYAGICGMQFIRYGNSSIYRCHMAWFSQFLVLHSFINGTYESKNVSVCLKLTLNNLAKYHSLYIISIKNS